MECVSGTLLGHMTCLAYLQSLEVPCSALSVYLYVTKKWKILFMEL